MSTPIARATGAALLIAALMPAAVRAQDPARPTSTAAVGVVRGRITETSSGRPVASAQVSIVGTTIGAQTNADGGFVLARVPAGARTLRVRRIGFSPAERAITVAASSETRIDVTIDAAASRLDQVVVTALGRTETARAIGTAQQTVSGPEIAQTQRENFVNSLQGRVAGVNVTSSSGVPGASSSITIRGISGISGSNQPLFIIDGLPMDNKTLNTNVLGSDAPGSATALNNRGVDFTNRAADINPEDIESIVVLKGAEGAALYGIDAANGAIIITTKRGKAGQGGLQYSNDFRFESVRSRPQIQQVYSPLVAVSSSTSGDNTAATFLYYGAPYAPGTTFYDNVDGFFRTGGTQQHNIAFSGGAADNRLNYRIAGGFTKQQGVVPNTDYRRINLTGASQGQVTKWLNADLSMTYTNAGNDQTFKGTGGPLLGLLVWPTTDNAKDYLTASGTRRRLANTVVSTEVDNPYFNINKNGLESRNNRILANLGLTFTPVSWGNLQTRIGADNYTNQNQIVRNPESAYGINYGGILDNLDDITRFINSQTLLNFNPHPLTNRLSISGLLGNQVQDYRSTADAQNGTSFLDPNFISINNALLRTPRTTIRQRRLVSAFGQAQLDYNRFLYLTVTGRNDWTSTIPAARRSFFYPSVSSSFVFSDAFPSLRRYMTGKLRAAYAEVGSDAVPYADKAFLESKTTSYGGYGYGFYGPNPNLKPEFAKSYEVGTELTFLQDRLGLDATVYHKRRQDQIVNDLRGSYATGYILFNLNGATTRNRGLEMTLRGTPVRTPKFAWDIVANFDKHHGEVVSLPNNIPEAYVSDTWLYGNVRAGSKPGTSTESLTGYFYLRNKAGQLVIDPTTGLPVRNTSVFTDAGYDRTPKYTVGLTNTVRYGRFTLSALLDMRRGGDVFNATQHFLTTRGLSMQTLDRDQPRVIAGVLRDGKENSATPTANTIVVIPSQQNAYYQQMSEELFIERNINWVRLRDLRLNYAVPPRFARNASLFVAGSDLFLITNYTGLDPVVNGNTAAVGGSGAAGIDYGNFPIPRGLNFGLTLGF